MNALRGDRFSTIALPPGASTTAVYALALVGGTLWVGTADGLLRLREGRAERVPLPRAFAGAPVRTLRPASRGGVWVGTTRGLVEVNDDSVQRVLTTQDGLPSDDVRAVLEASNGDLWVGTYRNGLVCLCQEGVVRYGRTGAGPKSDWIGALAEDRAGGVWIGTMTAGVSRYWNGRFESLSVEHGLPHPAVQAIFQDREGTMWLGTFGGGLASLMDTPMTTFGVPEGLSHDDTFLVRTTGDGSLWIGVGDHGGLDRLRGGRLTHYTTAEGLLDDVVNTVSESPDGDVLVGTERGVSRLVGHRFTSDPVNQLTGIQNVSVLHWSPDGALWMGTVDAGLWRVHAGALTRYSTSTGLPDNQIQTVDDDGRGGVWVATYRGGVVHIDNAGLRRYGVEHGLKTAFIRTLRVDPDGSVWIGTNGAGLHRISRDRVVAYRTVGGMCDRQVFAIVGDRLGSLWWTSNQGLCRVARRDVAAFERGELREIPATLFGVKDGMRTAECNGGGDPPGWVDEAGALWFPTIRGVVRVRPDAVDASVSPPSVVLDRVSVEGLDVADPLEVEAPSGAQQIEFGFSGLSLRWPHRLQYRYQLVGIDADWRNAGPVRTVSYSRVPPGVYTFRVVAVGAKGVMSPRAATARLVVHAAYYETKTFWAGIALALVCVALVGHRTRTAQLHQRAARLEVVVHTRTAAIERHRVDLESTTQRLQHALENIKRLEGLLPICSYLQGHSNGCRALAAAGGLRRGAHRRAVHPLHLSRLLRQAHPARPGGVRRKDSSRCALLYGRVAFDVIDDAGFAGLPPAGARPRRDRTRTCVASRPTPTSLVVQTRNRGISARRLSSREAMWIPRRQSCRQSPLKSRTTAVTVSCPPAGRRRSRMSNLCRLFEADSSGSSDPSRGRTRSRPRRSALGVPACPRWPS